MASGRRAGALSSVFRNIYKSLLKGKETRQKIGEDHLGNTYFELPADPESSVKYSKRWFETKDKENFLPEIPVEWEAWIRHKREDPPCQQELMRNQSVINLKKKNAAEIENKFQALRPLSAPANDESAQEGAYPMRDEYESFPGTKGK